MRSILLFAAFAAPLLAQAPAGTGALPLDKVIATVDGKPVTVGDVVKMVGADPRFTQYLLKDPQGAISEAMLLRELAAEGEKQKIADQSPLKEQIEFMR